MRLIDWTIRINKCPNNSIYLKDNSYHPSENYNLNRFLASGRIQSVAINLILTIIVGGTK